MASEVPGFTTDMCTGYGEGTREEPLLWAECCKTHDLYFWAGGTRYHRKLADKALKACVKEKGGGIHAKLIYLGVRIGGFSPIKIKGKQWGNAWGRKVRKTLLSGEEIQSLELSLRQNSELGTEIIDSFIEDLKQNNSEL